MQSSDGTAPAWLFAFVDLAFLILVAVTQFGIARDPIDLGELLISEVDSHSAQPVSPALGDLWQVRVHAPTEPATLPYALLRADGRDEGERLALDELRERLEDLRASRVRKPLLAADESSKSSDMLRAVALLEDHWPTGASALIAPVSAGP